MISRHLVQLKKASIRPISYSFNSNRHYTTIPFDTKPFPFNRFEPCCPDETTEKAENGFVPCQKHPIPKVLGRKIDMETDMKGSGIPKDRHMVICVGEQGIEWTRSKVEAVTDGSVYAINQLHHQYLHYQKTHHLPIPPPTDREMLTTICDRPPTSSSSSSPSTCDVMIFPEFRLYTQIDYQQLNLSTTKSSSSTDFVKVLETLWNNPSSSQLPQVTKQTEMKDIDAVILVCTHERRDMRCGVLGPLLVNAFRNCLNDGALKNKNVLVYGTSHFGGHKYAGNVIIHQKGLGGHMYGNVRECHVPSIIDRHIIHGKVIKELWRSQVTPPSL
ncbi:Sucrase/ferredoxin-like-domain-containing protein [Cunninghamella echinulata]|nr:Sucrase/ferredoxin-like-domain-containing protein [Cunninghamella echinulata]